MQDVLIRTGHGYENHSEKGRCEAFDGFEIIAAPLHQNGDEWESAFGKKARESRHFPRKDGSPGVTYDSHAIKLAKQANDRDFYLLVHHGGGREVWRVPSFYDGGDLADHITALPERLQYALLYTLYKMARESRVQAQTETRREWATAHTEKRIKTKRRNGRRYVEIVQQWEVDMKAEAKRRAA
jgi:hypothetical protein